MLFKMSNSAQGHHRSSTNLLHSNAARKSEAAWKSQVSLPLPLIDHRKDLLEHNLFDDCEEDDMELLLPYMMLMNERKKKVAFEYELNAKVFLV